MSGYEAGIDTKMKKMSLQHHLRRVVTAQGVRGDSRYLVQPEGLEKAFRIRKSSGRSSFKGQTITGLPTPHLHPNPVIPRQGTGNSRCVLCRSPSIMGILAANRLFLEEIGSLDGGMATYGGENVELSLRVGTFPFSLWDKRKGKIIGR